MVSAPPPPIIMGGLKLKICQNFVGTNFFLTFAGEYSSMGGVTFITTLSLFHFFRNSQHPEKSSVFFYKFLQGMWIHQELLIADILKFIKKDLQKNFTFCDYSDSCFGKKCSVSCIFRTIVVIVVIKIL